MELASALGLLGSSDEEVEQLEEDEDEDIVLHPKKKKQAKTKKDSTPSAKTNRGIKISNAGNFPMIKKNIQLLINVYSKLFKNLGWDIWNS